MLYLTKSFRLVSLSFGFSLMHLLGASAAPTFPPEVIFDLQQRSELQLARQREQERAQQNGPRMTDVRLSDELDQNQREDLKRFPKVERPCFTIDKIELIGEQAEAFAFALKSLDAMEENYRGRCLGARGLSVIVKRVQNAIIAWGYSTTRVLMEQQNLARGTLTLTVIPGHVADVKFKDDAPRITKLVNAFPAKKGDVLNIRDLEQGLENLKRVPTAEADIEIAPASEADAAPNQSDVLVKYESGFPIRLSASVDDSGLKATGRYLARTTFSYDNPLGVSDLLYGSLGHSIGQTASLPGQAKDYSFGYSVPYDYWNLSFDVRRNTYYQTVAGVNQAYVYSGTNTTLESKLSRVLYRDADRKISAYLKGFTRESHNAVDGTEVDVQHQRMVALEGGITDHENIWGGIVDVEASYLRGVKLWGALPPPPLKEHDPYDPAKILSLNIRAAFPFSLGEYSFTYHSEFRGQLGWDALGSQDKFAIGGRDSVRGFNGEVILSGERGFVLRNELGMNIGSTGQELYAGIDHGVVGGASRKWLVGDNLTGIVFGLRGGYKVVSYDIFAGAPLNKPQYFAAASKVFGFRLGWTM